MEIKIEKPDGSVHPMREFDTGATPDAVGPGVVAGHSSRRDFTFLNDHDQVSCSIERVRPIWAAGHCDTIPLELDEFGKPFFSPDEIRTMYGGEKYVCRFLDDRGRYIGCRTLHFRGIPPLINGLIVEDPNVVQKREKEEREAEKRKEKKESESDNLIKYLMEQQKIANEQALALLRSQVERQADPMAGVSQMLTMFQALEKFKGGGGGDMSGGMMTGLIELLKGGALSGAPPAASSSGFMPSAARLPAPAPVPVPVPVSAAPVPVPVPVSAAPVPVPVSEKQFAGESLSEHDDDISIADELAEMNEDEILSVVSDLIGKLGDERSIKLFQRLASLGEGAPVVDASGKTNS